MKNLGNSIKDNVGDLVKASVWSSTSELINDSTGGLTILSTWKTTGLSLRDSVSNSIYNQLRVLEDEN